VLCFQNEYSDEVWDNTQDSYYKGFAGAKPACTMQIMVKEGK
jgi:hypothetical protein